MLYLKRDNYIEHEETFLLRDTIERALTILKEKERTLLFMRYIEERTLEDIGYRVRLTSGRVRQIIKKAIKRLQHPNNRAFFEPYI